MTELFNALDTLATRWLVGGGSQLPLPAVWQEPLAGLPPQEQELAALALYAQARQFLSQPALPAGSRGGVPLPPLPLPTLPDALRRRFRRLLAAPAARELLPATLQLMASRGWIAHPYDFMPSATSAPLPAAYAGLRLWSAETPVAATTIDADNWDEFTPAQRRSLLLAQWQSDAAAARAVLVARFAGEGAEQRVSLLEMLSLCLSQDDAEFLQSLASDRSEKVRNLAQTLLARLGEKRPLADEQLAELREDFEFIRSGLLRRTINVAMAVKKNGAQRATRRTRLQNCSWSQLCSALQMQGPALIEAFRFEGRLDEAHFVDCALRSAPDAEVVQLSRRLLLEDPARELCCALSDLLPHLDGATRIELATTCLARGSALRDFSEILALAGGPLPDRHPLDLVHASRHWRRVEGLIQEQLKPEIDQALPALAEELWAVALLISASNAETLLARLIQRGLPAASPLLEPLHFNARLPSNH